MNRFRGSMVAIVTPFRNGAVDFPAYRRLLDFHLDRGTDGIVPIGTTGEAPTLTENERYRLVRETIRRCGRHVAVVAGSGTNSTRSTIEMTRAVRAAGAHGALIVTPYYNRPTQEGLFLHYDAVARAVPGFPLVLYNVPKRTGVNLLPPTVARLRRRRRQILAVKEACGDMRQTRELIATGVEVLSGDDAMTCPILRAGGTGVISVAANVIPTEMAWMCAAARSGRWDAARAVHRKYADLFDALFIETNPQPAKAALAMMGLIREELRLPLCPIGARTRTKLRAVLGRYGLTGGDR